MITPQSSIIHLHLHNKCTITLRQSLHRPLLYYFLHKEVVKVVNLYFLNCWVFWCRVKIKYTYDWYTTVDSILKSYRRAEDENILYPHVFISDEVHLTTQDQWIRRYHGIVLFPWKIGVFRIFQISQTILYILKNYCI